MCSWQFDSDREATPQIPTGLYASKHTVVYKAVGEPGSKSDGNRSNRLHNTRNSIREQAIELFLHHLVAFADACLQAGPVHHGDLAAAVVNQAGAL